MKYKDIQEEFEKDKVCSHCGGIQKRVKSFDIEWVCEDKKCGQRYIISFVKALNNNTKRVKKEILESVNERIAKVVQKRIKVDKDGIGSWKINPDDIYFADNLKNDLKNITFFVEEELK